MKIDFKNNHYETDSKIVIMIWATRLYSGRIRGVGKDVDYITKHLHHHI
jgi:hypothetical protein